MRIALVSTGEELLTGDIVDTNSAWLAETLSDAGMKLCWQVTVGDELDSLVDAFRLAAARSDICIVNGGLGPTTDDLSAEAAAQLNGEGLKELPEWTAKLKDYYKRLNRTMPESNLKQALVPESASMIDNPVGTACGFKVEYKGCLLMFTPGVPHEFKRMVNDQILPELMAKERIQAPDIHRWLTFGLSESLLADWLDPIQLPEGVVLGYRSAMPTIEVKLSAPISVSGETLLPVLDEVNQKLGSFVFAQGKTTLAEAIQNYMMSANQSLALAESCTGGMVADWLISVPGSSGYLERGFVTYSNEAKQESINVCPELLETHGAVSKEVTAAMAEGTIANSKASLALAISGIAGPAGGTETKPVGTVAFALATPSGTYSQLINLPNRGRTLVRKLSAALALDMLRRYLQKVDVFGGYAGVRVIERQGPETD